MPLSNLPFHQLARRLLRDLTAGHCVAVTGLSNSGKSTLMRSLASSLAEEAYQEASGRPGTLIYIDCNRAVAISAQAFYEVVLRSSLERLANLSPPPLVDGLRGYYQSVTEAGTAFSASLSFNLALTDLCEQLGRDLCLLIDEFEELYTHLDDRALLNLRALSDRFQGQLTFATATVRSLPELRGRDIEGEFAELFSRSTYAMPLLDVEEANALLSALELSTLDRDRERMTVELAGGHPGLLIATAQVLANLPSDWDADPLQTVRQETQPRAECLKIWSQLAPEEQASLATMALESDSRLPPLRLQHLERLGLLSQGELFSPIFADFVARRSRGKEVEAKGVYLDTDSGDVWVDGVRIPVLTDLEFRLLDLLYKRQDKLTDKYLIVTSVWGEEYLGEVDDARVEKLVSRLRGKIEPDPSSPIYLITQRGRGYKLLSKPARNG